MSREQTFDQIKLAGIIPAIRTSDADDAVQAVEAIRLGGIAVAEISLAPPNALQVLSAVSAACSHEVIVGAGSVLNGDDVRSAASVGAQFIVTPGFNLDAVKAARDLGLAIFAGAMTPTEVQDAHAAGADAVKLFPCFSTGGIRYLKALLGQYPATSFIASGGVGLDNCAEYIRAGACAIGVGGEIADFETMAGDNFRVFTVRAKRLYEAVHAARVLLEANYSFNVGEGR